MNGGFASAWLWSQCGIVAGVTYGAASGGLETALLVLLALGLIRAWMRLAARVRRGERILAWEPRRDVPWGLVDVVTSFVFMLSCQIVMAHLWGSPAEPGAGVDESRAALLGFAAASLLAMGMSIGLVVLRVGASSRDLGLRPRRLTYDVGVGWSAFLLLAPIVYSLQALFVYFLEYESRHPLLELIKQDDGRSLFAVVALLAVIVAPLTEEYFFRVLLQGWLEKVFGLFSNTLLADDDFAIPGDAGEAEAAEPPTTLAPSAEVCAARPVAPRQPPPFFWRTMPSIISAAFFAWMHASHGPDPIPLFVLALGLGYLYQSTHRLLPCVALHMALNGTTMWFVWLGLKV